MNATSPAERRTGYAILLLLALILAGVLHAQRRFNPAVTAANQAALAVASHPGVSFPELPDLRPAGAAEVFDADTLADKIDGRAELYLAAGFEELRCRRFQAGAGEGSWFEIFLYAMKDADAAYAVFTGQRREGAEPLDLGEEAYVTENALFLVQGARYVELVGSAVGQRDTLVAAARALLGAAPVGAAAARRERDLLPAEAQVPGTLELLPQDAFGFDQLDQVYAARYRTAEGEGLLFVATRASPEEAQALARAYEEFLLSNGAAAGGEPVDGARVFELFGRFELIWAEGAVAAGVHDATGEAWAREMAASLRRRLSAPEGAP
jgi:hypothetical protein